jgi:ABC-2 type transport system permease protein
MTLHRTGAIVLRQFYLLSGNLARVVPLFAWVAIDIILWGFITRYLNSITAAGFDFVPALLGAVLLWDFMVRVMQGITTTFFEDVWTRNFLNFFATPISTSEYVTGLVASSIGQSLVGLAVMVILASAFFGLSFLIYGAALGAFLLVLFLQGIALGIAGSAIVLRLGPIAEWFIWPIPAVLSPLAGVFYPLSTLPQWMRYCSRLLPASYVFEGMRAVVGSRDVSMGNLILGTGLATLYILLAGWFFRHIYRHAVRNGLIARYSAEGPG